MAQTNNWTSVGSLWLSTFAASGLISAYVLVLAWFNIGSVDVDPMERAADLACETIINTTVFDQAFGNVGIRDLRNLRDLNQEGQPRVRSVNTIFSLIRQSLWTAHHYNLVAMQNQAENDLNTLRHLQDDLRKKLAAEVAQDGKTYKQVSRILAHNSGNKLVGLTISLGAIQNKKYSSSGISARLDEIHQPYVLKGNLLAMTPVAVPGKEPFVLHQQATFATISAPQNFVTNKEDLPTAVLITADYENRARVRQRRQYCFICGQRKSLQNDDQNLIRLRGLEATCIALTFPQGRPQFFNSLADLLGSESFTTTGQWQQVANGSIPGPGRLSPPVAPLMHDMSARESLGIVFYHWLRQLNEPISPERLEQIIEARWAAPRLEMVARTEDQNPDLTVTSNSSSPFVSAEQSASQLPINSCLAADSDARINTFLLQTAPQEAGQKALNSSFSATPLNYPSSAIPLIIDSKGGAVTPGRTDFARQLTTDLLTEIYGTNLSAQDTIATAHILEVNAVKALRNSRSRIFLLQTDLASLKDRMRLESDSAKDKYLSKEISALETNLSYEQAEQKRINSVLNLAHLAKINGLNVARQSFDLSSRLLQVCRNGINRLDGLPGAFLLGRRFVFKPQLVALTENDLLQQNNSSTWLNPGLKIFGKVHDFLNLPDTKIMAEGRTLSEIMAAEAPVLPAVAETIIYDSRQLTNALTPGPINQISPRTLYEYPFKGMPLAERQLVFYAQKSLSSGQLVSWSTLVRDYVANYDQEGGANIGQAAAAASHGWFGTVDQPRLAGEWQLRAPLILLDKQLKDALKGATLTDPKTGQRMPQVPPVGPGLM